jgi:hypothetical protein
MSQQVTSKKSQYTAEEFYLSWKNDRKSDVPLGYGKWTNDATQRLSRSAADREQKVMASAMKLAYQAGSSIPMMAFMLWMSGNQVQIFTIMMLGMAFYQPIVAIFSVESHFARYKDSNVNLLNPKIIYCLLQLCSLGVACYKVLSLSISII